ncbi:unnamed protein product [Polarella glacialis]|uniref:Fungal lipase-type domain-containing protein n=1 Tax=Polarella glacialis TaxID=89957 RepID=A0A813J871_POLGL|nr:unnamed protein product [Polarella glacialis]
MGESVRPRSTGETTLFRTPQQHAASGVWLEGFSKRDAQAMLIVMPWAVTFGSLFFFVTLYVLQGNIHSVSGGVSLIVSGTHYVLAFLCAAYLPVAILLERPCSCCRRRGSRRTSEGWIALLPVAMFAGISLVYALSTHSLDEQSQTIKFNLIHGSLAFRAAATVEFLIQLSWLWAADCLRCGGQHTPRWKGSARTLLALLWCLTFWGPTDGQTEPSRNDHVVVIAGYSARVLVFLYCVMHVCRNCTRHCQCCCLFSDDWKTLKEPCSPGRARLRYLAYYLLTRPPFLLLINLPLGYPIAFLAPFASMIRCGFALLVAFALRPAPWQTVTEHPSEADTRESFDLDLALRLCDMANETYIGRPAPLAVIVSGCGYDMLNGEYLQDGRDAAGTAVYIKSLQGTNLQAGSCQGDSSDPVCTTAYLRKKKDGTWEFASGPSADCNVWAYAKDEDAMTPDQVEGLWFEVHGTENLSNTNLRVSTRPGGVKRRFERHGGCPALDVRWLLVEVEGSLTAPGEVDPPSEEALSQSDARSSSSELPQTEGCRDVSIVVAFRGTNSVQNMVTDANFFLQPLATSARSREANGPPRRNSPSRTFFNLEPHVLAKLRSRELQLQSPAQPTSSFITDKDAAVPLRGSDIDPRMLEAAEMPQSRNGREESRPRWMLAPCRLLKRCCVFLCFPFLPPSDFEDDDEEFEVATLDRILVHVGFAQAYSAVRDEVNNALQERLAICSDEGRTVRIYVTGHSMGGAIASFFALDLAAPSDEQFSQDVSAGSRSRSRAPVVYTFGSPRLGNAAFRSIYNVLVPETFRLVASRDPVPTLPPSISYRQLGREVWVDDAGELTYVMSWAMRHILPPRDTLWYHPMLSYYRLLNRSFRRKTGRSYPSAFGGETAVREALKGS